MILPRRRRRDSFLPWVQLLVDCAAIYLLLYGVFWVRFGTEVFAGPQGAPNFEVYQKSFLVTTIILVFFFRSYGLYRPARFFTFSTEIIKVLKAVAAGTIVLMALTFFIRQFSFSRTYMVMAGVLLGLGVATARVLLGLFVMWIDQSRGSFRNILIVGCDDNAKKLCRYYEKNPRFGTRVMGFLDDKLPKGTMIYNAEVVGKVKELAGLLKEHHYIHEVVLSQEGFSNEMLLKLLSECEKEMVSFRWMADMFGLIAAKMNVSYLAGIPLLSFVDSPLSDWENRVLKRLLDGLLSLVALIALSPLLLLMAILVKSTSAGPVFYGQQRIGQDGHEFSLYKFRTMRTDAEKETGPVWAKEHDPRRTPVGSFLRKTNLDELPQLWNVFRGDMSLVGPRPERPFFVSQFKEDIPRYMARHSIRSGITGWAQVNGLRGNTSIEERTKYDLYYIENWSLVFDVKILFMTLFATNNAY